MLSEADPPLPACAVGALPLAKRGSGNAGLPLRNISPSVSLWHHCLLPHWAPQVEWYLLGLALSVPVRFVTLTAEGLDKEPSHSTWVMQLWAHAFTLSPTEKCGAATGFSTESIPPEYCLEFLPCLPMGEIHKSCPYPCLIPCNSGKWARFCAWAMLLWLHLLSWAFSDTQQSCAIKMYCHGIPGERISKDYMSHFFGWLLPGIILPTAAMWNNNLLC